jgi:hypothetical protein
MKTNTLINLIGLQRNGCHAMANWLLKQSKHMPQTGLVKATPDEQKHGDLYHIKSNCNFYLWNQFWFKDQEPHAPSKLIPPDNDDDIETGIIVYEVAQINKFNTDFTNKDLIFGAITQEHNIVVLRDFCNMAASFYKIHGELPRHIALFWYHRILEVTNNTNFIHPKYYINYNEWFENPDYRQKIATDLNLDFTDYGLNDVLDFGKGSSFDHRTRDRQAQTMNINRRWRQLRDDVGFKKILQEYKDLVIISKKLFGEEYGP